MCIRTEMQKNVYFLMTETENDTKNWAVSTVSKTLYSTSYSTSYCSDMFKMYYILGDDFITNLLRTLIVRVLKIVSI